MSKKNNNGLDMTQKELLIRIDERQQRIFAEIREMNKTLGTTRRDVQSLKNWRAYLTGAFGVIVAIFTLFANWVIDAIAEK